MPDSVVPERLFSEARAQFPGTGTAVYLDTAARGLVARRARDAAVRQIDARMHGIADKAAMFATVESMRSRFAGLINATADEIAVTKNISDGLNCLAAALPWKTGDNVVLCVDLEHPNNVYPWLHLKERLGIGIKSVPGRNGHIPVDDLVGAMDGRTRAVAISTVTFTPGFRTHIEPLGQACRRRGVFLLADGAQSVGILHTDVTRLGLDGLAVSTQKGLSGLYGLGLLYCRREWADRMVPMFLARFGVDLGDAGEAAMGGEEYRLARGARRFDLGNYNFPAAAAADEALGLIAHMGSEAIEAHVTRLAHDLAGGLGELGLPVAGGEPGPHLGSIVAVGKIGGGGHDSADDPAMNALAGHLMANGVRFSVRRGLLRMSLHFYNDATDVERVVGLAREWVRRTA